MNYLLTREITDEDIIQFVNDSKLEIYSFCGGGNVGGTVYSMKQRAGHVYGTGRPRLRDGTEWGLLKIWMGR